MTYYKNKLNVQLLDRRGKIALSLAVLFISLVLIVFYLIQINKLVAKNFELRQLQNSFKADQEKNQTLLISLMQLRSFNNLQQAAKDLNLVTIDKANYLKTAPDFFALSE